MPGESKGRSVGDNSWNRSAARTPFRVAFRRRRSSYVERSTIKHPSKRHALYDALGGPKGYVTVSCGSRELVYEKQHTKLLQASAEWLRFGTYERPARLKFEVIRLANSKDVAAICASAIILRGSGHITCLLRPSSAARLFARREFGAGALFHRHGGRLGCVMDDDCQHIDWRNVIQKKMNAHTAILTGEYRQNVPRRASCSGGSQVFWLECLIPC